MASISGTKLRSSVAMSAARLSTMRLQRSAPPIGNLTVRCAPGNRQRKAAWKFLPVREAHHPHEGGDRVAPCADIKRELDGEISGPCAA